MSKSMSRVVPLRCVSTARPGSDRPRPRLGWKLVLPHACRTQSLCATPRHVHAAGQRPLLSNRTDYHL